MGSPRIRQIGAFGQFFILDKGFATGDEARQFRPIDRLLEICFVAIDKSWLRIDASLEFFARGVDLIQSDNLFFGQVQNSYAHIFQAVYGEKDF